MVRLVQMHSKRIFSFSYSLQPLSLVSQRGLSGWWSVYRHVWGKCTYTHVQVLFFEGPCRNLSTNDYNRRMPGSRGRFVCVSTATLYMQMSVSFMSLCFRRRQGLHKAYPTLWIFSACPPDTSVRCVSPGFYAVIGASAMLGGVTRMTSM